MALDTTLREIEGPVRDWARAAVPSVGNRVFFGLPRQVTFPVVLLAMYSFTPDAYLPSTRATIQFDVLGAPLDKGGSKNQVTLPMLELVNAVENLPPNSVLGPLRVYGSSVMNTMWRPGDDGKPRYMVDTAWYFV